MQTFNRRDLLKTVPAALAIYAGLGNAKANTKSWPSREIRMIHPFSAGDQTDIAVRILAEEMAAILEVPIIVENKPGAGGVPATNIIGNAKPDGYTIGYISNGNVSLDAIFKRYKFLELVTPISRIAQSAQTIYASSKSGYKSLNDFVADVQQNPGKISVGIGGLGAPSHVMWEIFASHFDPELKVNLIPFKSSSESLNALLGGHIDAGVSFLTAMIPYIQNPGRIDVLGISSRQRNPLVSSIPTISETIGQPFEYMNWNGLCCTKGVPAEIQAILFEAVQLAAKSEKYRQYTSERGGEVNPSPSQDDFIKLIEASLIAEEKLAKDKNIQV